MATLTSILAAFVASHLGGMALGGTLGRKNIFGFGVKAVQFAAKRRAAKRYEKARHEHQEWLSYAAADESPETD